MQIVSERVAAQRAVTSMEARELTVASFNLTEEELSKPLPGRVRRRGPGPRTENAAGDVPPETGPASAERGSKEARGRGGNEPNAERPARKPKPPRAPKRPLSEIALLPDETRPPTEAAPKLESPEPSAGGDDFSAGIDLPATPPEN